MTQPKRTPGGDAVTDLVLDVFRLSNQLIAAGDRLVAPLGLTSARWQILGAIVAAEPLSPSLGSLATSARIAKTCSGSSMIWPRKG